MCQSPLFSRLPEYGRVAILNHLIEHLPSAYKVAYKVDPSVDPEFQFRADEIARELHDGVGQLLTAARLMVEGTPGVPPVVTSLLSDAAIELQRVCLSISEAVPVALSDDDALALEPGLRRLSERCGSMPGITCTLHVGSQIPALPAHTAHDMQRIAQEAVSNALRHSGASAVSLSLSIVEESIEMNVLDNGTWKVADPHKHHSGLVNMQTRAALSGGTVEIRKSDPTGGTRVRCRIPLTVVSQATTTDHMEQ